MATPRCLCMLLVLTQFALVTGNTDDVNYVQSRLLVDGKADDVTVRPDTRTEDADASLVRQQKEEKKSRRRMVVEAYFEEGVCQAGIVNLDSEVCCPAACGSCGGANCSLRGGGATQCCLDELAVAHVCKDNFDVACKIPASCSDNKDCPEGFPICADSVCQANRTHEAVTFVAYSKAKRCNGDLLYEANAICSARCASTPDCMFYTEYAGGWCQLSQRCDYQRTADDASAATFVKSKACATGIVNMESQLCCPATCGGCGGVGCSARPGGANQCCLDELAARAPDCLTPLDVACKMDNFQVHARI